jgi:hypothetical protein
VSAHPGDAVVIGWTEYVDLPRWGVRRLRAKVDTGARSSALHVENLCEEPRGYVSFEVVLHRRKRERRVQVRAKVKRRGVVRSSSGEGTRRIFVSTALRIGPVQKEIEVGLVDRGQMIHRMLLGRSALSGPFLIDVDRRLALGTPPRRKRRAARRAAGGREP